VLKQPASITASVRCWVCGVTYPNPHKYWCLSVEKAVKKYDKRMRKRNPPRVKRVRKEKPPSKKCALCRAPVLEGAFCSDVCRSDAWRLFSDRLEHVNYGHRRRTYREGGGTGM
jgi:hypothetical protein